MLCGMSARTFVIGELATLKARMVLAFRAAEEFVKAGHGVEVIVRERKSKRSVEQNKKLNAMCGDISEQVMWHGQSISRDDWRHMFVAAYRKEQRIVPGINGGFVVLGASSRNLTVSECSDVIEMLNAFGAEHGVKFSEHVMEAA